MRSSSLLSVFFLSASAYALAALSSCSSQRDANNNVGADASVEAGAGGDGGVTASGDGGDAANLPGPMEWNRTVTRPDEGAALTARAACLYAQGALPGETLGPSFPVGSDIPIQNIVVVMMENHSFDSYFGHLNKYAGRTDIESAPDTATNPDSNGMPQPFTHALHPCVLDVNHEWDGTHQEIDNGKMDGFVVANDGYNASALPATSTDPSLSSGARAMWWYDERDLPFYYKLASTFAIADHYHASVPGPTFPNRMFLLAATSFGETYNTFPDLSAYPFPTTDTSVLDELDKRQTKWMLYSDGFSGAVSLYGLSLLSANTRWGRPVTANFAAFQQAAAAGTLPPVSFVDPNLMLVETGSSTDEHPPGDIQSGQLFVSQVVQAVMSSPQWPHLALFIMHDEHGGFYDHVAPPPACAPDKIAPIFAAGTDAGATPGGFDLYGLRVLLIAVSPYAKKSYVGHHIYDHTSVTRFIEAKFQIPALTARDANAEPPMDLFDFSAAPSFLTPPNLPAPTVDPTQLSYCQATFGN